MYIYIIYVYLNCVVCNRKDKYFFYSSDSWERVSVGDCAGSAENVAEADRENEEMIVESEEKEAIEGTTTTKVRIFF